MRYTQRPRGWSESRTSTPSQTGAGGQEGITTWSDGRGSYSGLVTPATVADAELSVLPPLRYGWGRVRGDSDGDPS